jgi:hypothetical protein
MFEFARWIGHAALKTFTGEVMVVPCLKHLSVPERLRKKGIEVLSEKLLGGFR